MRKSFINARGRLPRRRCRPRTCAYGSLARILADLGQHEAALTASRAATRQLGAQPEKRRWEAGFLLHVALLAERAQSDPAALAESFAVMQHLSRLPHTLELADAQ